MQGKSYSASFKFKVVRKALSSDLVDAERTRGFGMDILAYDAQHNDFLADLVGFEYVDLPELMERSRIVTIHCPLNDATHHLIDHDELQTDTGRRDHH